MASGRLMLDAPYVCVKAISIVSWRSGTPCPGDGTVLLVDPVHVALKLFPPTSTSSSSSCCAAGSVVVESPPT